MRYNENLVKLNSVSHYMKCSVELVWCSGSIMDCHATARGSIPSGNGVFIELRILRKGQ